jgi:hypothetical protein
MMLPDHNSPIGTRHRDAMEQRAAERGDVMGIPERKPRTEAQVASAIARKNREAAEREEAVIDRLVAEGKVVRPSTEPGAVGPSDAERWRKALVRIADHRGGLADDLKLIAEHALREDGREPSPTRGAV